MILPNQSPPVSRTLQGDYVERDGAVVWVPWRLLTQDERDRLWWRVMQGGMVGSGGVC